MSVDPFAVNTKSFIKYEDLKLIENYFEEVFSNFKLFLVILGSLNF